MNQAATSAVAREFADDASGLFNAARNLGGSIGLAVIATLQDQREALHYARLAESLSANSPRVQDAVGTSSVAPLARELARQATVLTHGNLYWAFGIALLATIPLVLLMRPLKEIKDMA